MTFHDWLIGNAGIEGEYQYQTMHLLTVLIVTLVVIIFVIIGLSKRVNETTKIKVLKAIAIFQISFEILWRLIYIFIKKDSVIACWPMYPCNLGGILIPIIALTNSQLGKKLFYVFGFVGGILTFALPEGIFSNNILVFPILKSILQHTGLLIIPTYEYVIKRFKPSVLTYPYIIIGCLIHTFNCEVIDRLLGFTGDYMFYRSGLPFTIPGIPSFITISIFGLIVLFILSFTLNIKESVNYFKTWRKTKSIN